MRFGAGFRPRGRAAQSTGAPASHSRPSVFSRNAVSSCGSPGWRTEERICRPSRAGGTAWQKWPASGLVPLRAAPVPDPPATHADRRRSARSGAGARPNSRIGGFVGVIQVPVRLETNGIAAQTAVRGHQGGKLGQGRIHHGRVKRVRGVQAAPFDALGRQAAASRSTAGSGPDTTQRAGPFTAASAKSPSNHGCTSASTTRSRASRPRAAAASAARAPQRAAARLQA